MNRKSGFTLIELMVVISILMVLMGLLVVVGGAMRTKARVAATSSLIEQIGLTLQNYKSLVGAFPPDGIDSDVITEEGTELQSGACLAYYLSRPLKLKTKLPGGKYKILEREPMGNFGDKFLYHDQDDEDALEFVDGWQNSIHYDNLIGTDAFSEQDSGDVHLQECEVHGVDPREDADVVDSTGGQNSNEYDVWSHGPNGHSEEEDIGLVLANFTVKTQED